MQDDEERAIGQCCVTFLERVEVRGTFVRAGYGAEAEVHRRLLVSLIPQA
jgi:hypothetical protein